MPAASPGTKIQKFHGTDTWKQGSILVSRPNELIPTEVAWSCQPTRLLLLLVEVKVTHILVTIRAPTLWR